MDTLIPVFLYCAGDVMFMNAGDGNIGRRSKSRVVGPRHVIASGPLRFLGTPLRTACHGVTLWSVWSAPPRTRLST